MDSLGTTAPPSPGSIGLRRKHPPGERAPRLAWILFLLLGLPFLLMAMLTILAAARIYVEPLRALWLPWPPDVLKPFIGIAVFAASLAYLAYRSGRGRGFHSGHVAGLAEGRNLAEGWKPLSEQLAVPPPPAPAEPIPTAPNPPVAPTEGSKTRALVPVESTTGDEASQS